MSNRRKPIIKSSEPEKSNQKQRKLTEQQTNSQKNNKELDASDIQDISIDNISKLKEVACKKCGKSNLKLLFDDKKQNLVCSDCEIMKIQACANAPVDITEFFINLTKFLQLNDSKRGKVASEQQIEVLEDMIQLIQENKKQIKNLKESIGDLIKKYSASNQITNKIELVLIKYLSSHDDQQKEELMNYLKQHFLFKENKFHMSIFNSDKEKINQLLTSEYSLLKIMDDLIIKLEQENKHYNLEELNILNCPKKCVYNSFTGKRFMIKNYIKYLNNKITLISGINDETQYYIDLKLDHNKKYVLLIQFDMIPQEQFTVAVAQRKLLEARIAYDEPNCHFSKTFFPSWQPSLDECSNITKGGQLAFFPQLGQIIEVRISISENKVEFTDYPNRVSINSNFDNYQFENSDQYVIGFTLTNQQQISILSLSETTDFAY